MAKVALHFGKSCRIREISTLAFSILEVSMVWHVDISSSTFAVSPAAGSESEDGVAPSSPAGSLYI